MLELTCSGTPYQIGFRHGQVAKKAVGRSIDFYTGHFRKACKLGWAQVQELAVEYEPNIRKQWPAYLEEMQGIADGSSTSLSDILALNIRTELAFGMFSDGCTSLSYLTSTSSFLGQNWDWELAQKQNLILLTISQPSKPTIKMVTEAGIIGKIGLNSAGVGVCLNAIRAKGVDASRIPVHLGLRLVLESRSRKEAIANLSRTGVASSCHMLIADETGGSGVEWSAVDRQLLEMNEAGQVTHTNHFVLQHPGVVDAWPWEDTVFREKRIRELLEPVGAEAGFEQVQGLFVDEKNYPAAICRAEEDTMAATLFNIVMELKERRAEVILGRPSKPEGRYMLSFEEPRGSDNVAARM